MYFDLIISIVDMVLYLFLAVFLISTIVIFLKNRNIEMDKLSKLGLHLVLSYAVASLSVIVIIFTHEHMRSISLSSLIFKTTLMLFSLAFCIGMVYLISKVQGMGLKDWLPWNLKVEKFDREYIILALEKHFYFLLIVAPTGAFLTNSIIGIIDLFLNKYNT